MQNNKKQKSECQLCINLEKPHFGLTLTPFALKTSKQDDFSRKKKSIRLTLRLYVTVTSCK